MEKENNELYEILKKHIEVKDNNKYLDKFATLFLTMFIASTIQSTMHKIKTTLKELGVIKDD